ncbi:unnamed protein product [Owenia fusiformis]|uniref:Uncharacterized protein n=1 Tax=Owenia fusiformis TaxID=6347 RepID=A0A8S4NYC2_OWEFU|nr:unnamed protein product [Owenia fusiformis]
MGKPKSIKVKAVARKPVHTGGVKQSRNVCKNTIKKARTSTSCRGGTITETVSVTCTRTVSNKPTKRKPRQPKPKQPKVQKSKVMIFRNSVAMIQ